MKETLELRVNEDHAERLFRPDEGSRVGASVRVVRLDSSDDRLAKVGELQRTLRELTGQPFFYGWDIRRSYSRAELDRAELFTVRWDRRFEPVGEECGTKKDESSACGVCGSGAIQEGPLRLRLSKLPRNCDFAASIAGERVVSEPVRRAIERQGVKGIRLGPVESVGSRAEKGDWWQLSVDAVVDVVSPTVVGIGPFDRDAIGEYRPPCGHVLGLNLLSEVTVSAASVNAFDVFESQQYVGVRRGLLRPERLLFVRPSVRSMILRDGLRGWTFEVAHLR